MTASDTGKPIAAAEKSAVPKDTNAIMSFFSIQLEEARNLTGTARVNIKRAAGLAWSTVRQPVLDAIQVVRDANSSKGTSLRHSIADVRSATNESLNNVEVNIGIFTATVDFTWTRREKLRTSRYR